MAIIRQSSFDNAISGNYITSDVNYSPFQILEGSMAYSCQISTAEAATAGGKSMRFELRNTDPQVRYGNNRAEVTVINNTDTQIMNARWYRVKMKIKAADWASDSKEEVITQWHDRSDSCSASPTLSLEIINNKWRIRTRYSTANYCTSQGSRIERIPVEIGNVTFDVWVDWLFEYLPATNNTGFIRVYRNGVKVFELLNAPNHYIGADPMPYWKIGIYKWFYAQTNDGGSTATSRILYVDDVIVYDSATTLNDIYPVTSNQAPSCSAGTAQTHPGGTTSTTLTGSASDPEGGAMTYAWTQVSGPNTASITSPTALSTGVTGMITGTYVFRLTVTDNGGLTASATVGVTIDAVNTAPVVEAGPAQILVAGTTLANLDGEASDAEDVILTNKVWTVVSKPVGAPDPVFLPNANDWNPAINNLTAGTYVLRLTVTDSNGASSSDTTSITIAAANQPPVVSAGSNQSLPAFTTSTTLFGSATDADGTIPSRVWSVVQGPNMPTITNPGNNTTTVTSMIAGDYIFRFLVTDNNGAQSSANVSVHIAEPPVNNQPTVDVSASPNDMPYQNYTQLFSTGADTEGPVTYEWVQLEGPECTIVNPTNQNPTIVGLQKGDYLFRVTVTDSNGAKASAEVNLNVFAGMRLQIKSGAKFQMLP